jgi:hypothetical protein
MTPDMLTDTVLEWFQNLNYEYMILHIIICYGLYYSKNLRWIVEYFSPIKKKGISKAVWLVGGILAIMEMIRFLPFISENNLSISMIVEKVIAIIHSYIVIQVFVEPIVNTIHKWMDVFKRSANDMVGKKED